MRYLALAFLFLSTLHSNEWIDEARATAPKTEEILTLFNELETNHLVLETGSDDLRVKYVHAQGCIEQMLARRQELGQITDLVGIIHTPLPATPLCVRPEETSTIEPRKWETVLSRAQIIREYLAKGSKLYIVYPEGGLEKRTPDQQAVYASALEQYSTLIDWTLSSNTIEPDMIGATYLFRGSDNELYAFSIKARQITDMQPEAEWGIWFGPLTDTAISARVDAILSYLSSVGGPTF
jgi:hypothetical protein